MPSERFTAIRNTVRLLAMIIHMLLHIEVYTAVVRRKEGEIYHSREQFEKLLHAFEIH